MIRHVGIPADGITGSSVGSLSEWRGRSGFPWPDVIKRPHGQQKMVIKKDVDDMEVCRRRLDLLGSESFQIAFALEPREALRVIH
ncbi:MAG: hypothetical protein ACON4H_11665 [Rubripirellula sp.]